MKTIEINMDGQNTIEATADMFIVPNAATLIKSTDYTYETRLRNAYHFKEATGYSYNQDTDHIVQVWMVSKDDLGSDNLGDHGFGVMDTEGNEWRCSDYVLFGNLPSGLIKNMCEGDSIDLTMKTQLTRRLGKAAKIIVDVTLKLHVTAKQLPYRYQRFGRFEEALAYVYKN